MTKSNPDVDMLGNPLWLDSDQEIVDTFERITDNEVPALQAAYVTRTPTYFN